MDKLFIAGSCPLCSAALAFEQDDEHYLYECTGKPHFSGIAPASLSLEEVLRFDLTIKQCSECPLCNAVLLSKPVKTEHGELKHTWCDECGLYGRQEPIGEQQDEHPFKGPFWYTWLGKNKLIPQSEYDERIKAGKQNNRSGGEDPEDVVL